MRFLFLWVLCLTAGCATEAPVKLVPESSQAARALKIIDAYHVPRPSPPPKTLHVVYFTPSDRDPIPDYERRLTAVLNDIRTFYRVEMKRNGFGPVTFELERDAQGQPVFHLIKGQKTKKEYADSWQDRRKIIGGECRPTLQAAGISAQQETVIYFCNLADWNAQTGVFTHPTPFSGNSDQQSGWCWVMDIEILNLDYLTNDKPVVNDFQFGKVPIGRRNFMFVGGIAHELGHAFGLPHSGRRQDELELGTSLMGAGNLSYGAERRGAGKGASLTMTSAMRLAARPIFNGSDKGMNQPGLLTRCDITLAAPPGQKAAIRVEGEVKGSPPVYAIIAYFDSVHDGGYRAPGATAIPDDHGHFAIEVNRLFPCKKGELRIAFCHVNGAISERRFQFSVTPDGVASVSQ